MILYDIVRWFHWRVKCFVSFGAIMLPVDFNWNISSNIITRILAGSRIATFEFSRAAPHYSHVLTASIEMPYENASTSSGLASSVKVLTCNYRSLNLVHFAQEYTRWIQLWNSLANVGQWCPFTWNSYYFIEFNQKCTKIYG